MGTALNYFAGWVNLTDGGALEAMPPDSTVFMDSAAEAREGEGSLRIIQDDAVAEIPADVIQQWRAGNLFAEAGSLSLNAQRLATQFPLLGTLGRNSGPSSVQSEISVCDGHAVSPLMSGSGKKNRALSVMDSATTERPLPAHSGTTAAEKKRSGTAARPNIDWAHLRTGGIEKDEIRIGRHDLTVAQIVESRKTAETARGVALRILPAAFLEVPFLWLIGMCYRDIGTVYQPWRTIGEALISTLRYPKHIGEYICIIFLFLFGLIGMLGYVGKRPWRYTAASKRLINTDRPRRAKKAITHWYLDVLEQARVAARSGNTEKLRAALFSGNKTIDGQECRLTDIVPLDDLLEIAGRGRHGVSVLIELVNAGVEVPAEKIETFRLKWKTGMSGSPCVERYIWFLANRGHKGIWDILWNWVVEEQARDKTTIIKLGRLIERLAVAEHDGAKRIIEAVEEVNAVGESAEAPDTNVVAP